MSRLTRDLWRFTLAFQTQKHQRTRGRCNGERIARKQWLRRLHATQERQQQSPFQPHSQRSLDQRLVLILPQNAIDLAVFRVVVCLVALLSADIHTAAHFATFVHVPLLPLPTAQFLHSLAILALMSCLLGFFSRISALISCVSLAFLLSLPIAAGAFRHYHHLVWFLALLAASPCGDALSLDRVLGVRQGKMPVILPPSRAYGLALDLAWLLLGLIFFFPGLWKLLNAGQNWPQVMLQNMHWKWAQFHKIPQFRLDLHPQLLALSAWSVIAFELLFLPLQFLRKTRPFLLLAALLFHFGAATFMYLSFTSLWLCYAGLFHWTPALEPWQTRILQKFQQQNAQQNPQQIQRKIWPIALLCMPLLVGVLHAGATRDVFSWPFACYPTFDVAVGDWMPRLDLQTVNTQGQIQNLPLNTGLDSQQNWGLQWRLLRDQNALRDFVQKQQVPNNTQQIQGWKVLQNTQPGHWQETKNRQLLLALPVLKQ